MTTTPKAASDPECHQWRDRYHYLPALINRFDFKVGVEVGVAGAGHVRAILDNTKVLALYGVDPYRHRSDYHDLMNLAQEDFDKLYNNVLRITSSSRFCLFRCTSLETLYPQVVDFVYIDGEHTYEEVLLDIGVWYPRVQHGGVVSGDDYAMEPVRRAVDYFCRHHHQELVVEDGLFWWFRKK